MQENKSENTPEHGETIAASTQFDPITPIDFSPPDAQQKKAGFKPRWPHFLIAAFLMVAGISGWFVLTAKSVSIQASPISATVEVLSGFHVRLGQRYLMRPGEFEIRVSQEGYYDDARTLLVTDVQAQDFPIELRELPGIVSFSVTGASGELSGAMVSLGDVPLGRTPLRDIEIDPGGICAQRIGRSLSA